VIITRHINVLESLQYVANWLQHCYILCKKRHMLCKIRQHMKTNVFFWCGPWRRSDIHIYPQHIHSPPGGAGPTGGCQYCTYSQMSLNSSISWPDEPLVLLSCGVNRLIGFLSSIARFIAIRQWGSVVCRSSTSLAHVLQVLVNMCIWIYVPTCRHEWNSCTLKHLVTVLVRIKGL